VFQGVSWCPDCVEAEPHIDDALAKFGENTVFVTVDVGDR
jgi:thiol-disulfide isomerase/thioredoxin